MNRQNGVFSWIDQPVWSSFPTDDITQVATIVLLATTVAGDPTTADARIYLAAGAAVAIAVTRAAVRTLPAPIANEALLEMQKPLHAESTASPSGDGPGYSQSDQARPPEIDP